MNRSTRSVWAAPICKPTLAPPMWKKAGALQPPVTRRLMTPLPPRPPTTKPALIIPGKTATASALSSKSFGMERSGAPIICSKTRDAFSDFFDASFCCLGLAFEAGFVAVRSLSPCRAKSVEGIMSATANTHAARRVVRDESFIHSLLYELSVRHAHRVAAERQREGAHL